ncbi:Mrp/NBP35 family ATP-binding protein, partial [bacterium]|nr:Mrp/NBP35 family ATP-binding protein [bacterium]
LFKSGTGEKTASNLNIDFLGDVPLEPEIVSLSDKGQVFVKDNNSIAAEKFGEIVSKIEKI